MKNRNFGYNAKEQKALDSSAKMGRVTDGLVLNITNRLSMASYYVLHAKFDFGCRRIVRFWSDMVGIRTKWGDGDITTNQMECYCINRGIKIREILKTIPMSQKIKLSQFHLKKGQNARNADKVIDAAFVVYIMATAIVLHEAFNFSIPKINEFWKQMADCVDSYARHEFRNECYLDDKTVNDMLIEECQLDAINGIVLRKNGKYRCTVEEYAATLRKKVSNEV